MVGHCSDEAVLGSQFYVMDHVPGLILRGDLPDGLTLGPATARDLALGMFDALADLHSVEVKATGLDTFYRGAGLRAAAGRGLVGPLPGRTDR